MEQRRFPAMWGPSAFGTRLSAFMGFLTGTCRLSRRVALSILQEGLDLRVAAGMQSNVENRISAALKPAYKEIETQVRIMERVNSAVTTLKRQGKKCLNYLTEALDAWKTGS